MRSPTILISAVLAVSLAACLLDAADPAPAGRTGKTIYVSKLGDGTDGSGWRTAFRTIQAALLAVPDAEGGHRVIVRPDVYAEANLYPSFRGARGAYNLLAGDFDGSLGSGAKGWVVVDSGAPDVIVRTDPDGPGGGNPTYKARARKDGEAPETGLKSVDWWGPWKCDPTFSGLIWDRWTYRNIYATGSEGGIGWDLTREEGKEFSAVVEDCVGIGRFAGGCVMAHVHRPGEPVLFRRCYFLCLDVWGDAGGVYVRAHNREPSEVPDAVFEDSTIVGPDNAVQVGYPGFSGYTRLRFKGCRLFVMNFSQPHGTPSTGVIYSDLEGKYLHVELEDTLLLGYRPFGSVKDPFTFSLKGRVSAYVQYRQAVPDGIERLRFWPVEKFESILPPRWGAPPPLGERGTSADVRGVGRRPQLRKVPVALGSAMESTPVVFGGRTLLVHNQRDDTKNKTDGYTASMRLLIRDLRTGEEVARFGEGHSFASAFVDGQELSVFASEGTNRDWFQGLHRFSSRDLKDWKREPAVPPEGGEHLFNSSVTRDDQGFLMAYESDRPATFCFKFARSKDLSRWEKVPNLVFAGLGDEYSACPVIRFIAPYYYAIYLHAAVPGHTGWVSFLARSRDLADWELSPFNPILEAGPGEGINNSDVDLFEHEGSTYLFYATGDQSTWGAVRIALYDGPLKDFFEGHFPEGAPAIRTSARRP